MEQAGQDKTHMAGHMGIARRVMDSEECLLGVTTLWTGDAERHKLVLELKSELASDIQDCTSGSRIIGEEHFPDKLDPNLSNSNLAQRASLMSLDSLDSGYSGQSA